MDPKHPHAYLQICRIQLDDDSNPSGIESGDISSSLVKTTFDELSEIEYFASLRKKFKIEKASHIEQKEAEAFLKRAKESAESKQKEIDEVQLLAKKSQLNNRRGNLEIEEDEKVLPISMNEI